MSCSPPPQPRELSSAVKHRCRNPPKPFWPPRLPLVSRPKAPQACPPVETTLKLPDKQSTQVTFLKGLSSVKFNPSLGRPPEMSGSPPHQPPTPKHQEGHSGPLRHHARPLHWTATTCVGRPQTPRPLKSRGIQMGNNPRSCLSTRWCPDFVGHQVF